MADSKGICTACGADAEVDNESLCPDCKTDDAPSENTAPEGTETPDEE